MILYFLRARFGLRIRKILSSPITKLLSKPRILANDINHHLHIPILLLKAILYLPRHRFVAKPFYLMPGSGKYNINNLPFFKSGLTDPSIILYKSMYYLFANLSGETNILRLCTRTISIFQVPRNILALPYVFPQKEGEWQSHQSRRSYL